MRVALINTKPTARAKLILNAFAEGVRRGGDEAFWVERFKGYAPLLDRADVGIQVCLANKWHNDSDHGKFRLGVAAHMQRAGKRLLVIDTGFLHNQTELELRAGTKQKHAYFANAVGIGGTKAEEERYETTVYYEIGYDGLKRRAAYYNDNAPADRWATLERLGEQLKPWRTEGKHILVLGQTFHGLSSQHVNIYEWYAGAIKRIRAVTQRPILFRQHPRMTKMRSSGAISRGATGPNKAAKDRTNIRNLLPEVENFHWSKADLVQEDLVNAWACVVFSTNAAVAAVLAGIPVFVGDPSCMAWDVGNHSLKNLEQPVLPDRLAWAHRLAYAQWTVREMREGLPWQHLRPHAQKQPGSGTPFSS